MLSSGSPEKTNRTDVFVSRRGAAIKASAHFSHQLQSDDDDDGRDVGDDHRTLESGSESDPFGEPKRHGKGKGTVKVRYGGRGGRTSIDGSGAGAAPSSVKPSKFKRRVVPKPKPVLASTTSATLNRRKVAPPPTSATRGRYSNAKKRPLSEVDQSASEHEEDCDNLSDLTPLSSPISPAGMRTPAKNTMNRASALKRTPTTAAGSPSTSASRIAPLGHSSSLIGGRSSLGQSSLLGSTGFGLGLGISGGEVVGSWNVGKLGAFVWVLVNGLGEVVEDLGLDLDQGKDDEDEKMKMRMWWPGIVSASIPFPFRLRSTNPLFPKPRKKQTTL